MQGAAQGAGGSEQGSGVACVRSFTTRYLPAKETVATVSSWAHLPWMMDVWSLTRWLPTAFQTFDTHGQVVSTMLTPLSFSSFISWTLAPNAGRTATSPSPRTA